MSRRLKDWLPAYLEYTAGTEAPSRMHFWTGVSCIAACLRRKVWMDMKRFRWYPNFYIILVAPPGIISKTTTMDMGMDLVKKVPGIKFGPDVVTWQALVTAFAGAQEDFQYGEDWVPMSPITLASGELGNLINPQDRDLVNLFIALWDARSSFEKVTKGSGTDVVSAPWINMVGCTTPHWIADNMPAAVVGGGFTSRCVFVYADRKEKFIAYPDEHVRSDHDAMAEALAADLEHMSLNLVGNYELTEEARVWGRRWYERLWGEANQRLDNDQIDGYLARKQTHMHKLAVILSASRGDDQRVLLEDLVLAEQMLLEAEQNLGMVFSRIGKSEESMHVDRLLSFLQVRRTVTYFEAYQHVHSNFPDFRDFNGVLEGLTKSGLVRIEYAGNGTNPQNTRLVFVGAGNSGIVGA